MKNNIKITQLWKKQTKEVIKKMRMHSKKLRLPLDRFPGDICIVLLYQSTCQDPPFWFTTWLRCTVASLSRQLGSWVRGGGTKLERVCGVGRLVHRLPCYHIPNFARRRRALFKYPDVVKLIRTKFKLFRAPSYFLQLVKRLPTLKETCSCGSTMSSNNLFVFLFCVQGTFVQGTLMLSDLGRIANFE